MNRLKFVIILFFVVLVANGCGAVSSQLEEPKSRADEVRGAMLGG